MRQIQQLAQGFARLQVIDKDRQVVRDTGWKKNLILNQGMDGLVSRSWAGSFEVAAVGTGTAPLTTLSGITTASQNNVQVTLSGGSFRFTDTATDATKVLKWDTGETAQIVNVLSSTVANVTDSKIKSAGTFRMFLVTQMGLAAEARRTTQYEPTGCSTVLTAPNVAVLTRCWNFPVELSPVSYTELGVSWDSAPGANLFARILLDPPMDVLPTQYLRAFYQLTLTLSPASPNTKSVNVSGWPIAPAVNTTGSEMLEDWGIYQVAGDGTSQPIRTVSGVPIVANEPFAPASILVSSDTQTLNAPGVAPLNRWGSGAFAKSVGLDVYTPGTYFRTKTGTLMSNQANGSATIRTIALGHIIDGSNFLPTFTCLFAQAQTKVSPYFLVIVYKFSWGRILS